MSSPGPDPQGEQINSSQSGNASSSLIDVPSVLNASTATPNSTTPSLTIKIPKVPDLSSIPVALKLSSNLITSDDGDGELVIYSDNAADCPLGFEIKIDLVGDEYWCLEEGCYGTPKRTEVKDKKTDQEDARQLDKKPLMAYIVSSRDANGGKGTSILYGFRQLGA